jgi:hypothetical protein
MASTKKDETPKEGSTAHQSVPGDVEVTGAPGDGAMPMGMLGDASSATGGDPDQKSTHVPPKTVESTLPDGSPKYMDPPAAPKKKKASGSGTARYETVGRVIIAETDDDGEKRTRMVEPGEVIELDEKTATSLGENLKPAS